MFTAKKLMFLYAVTPVHMGAGTSLGVVDNPIQREVHTGHPVFAGSGTKGALRHEAESFVDKGKRKLDVSAVFGPESSASDHAGAASFSDAQLVAFPVRSLKEGYVYATSPGVLARLGRLASFAGVSDFPSGDLPAPNDEQAVVLDDAKLLACSLQSDQSKKRLILESYAFDKLDDNTVFQQVATWVAKYALPGGQPDPNTSAAPPEKEPRDAHKFFRDKLGKHLVLLSDTQLAFFARNSTVVEAHVSIDDDSGTAAETGLFFTENLPPESVMVSLAMASVERSKKGSTNNEGMLAETILQSVTEAFQGRLVQFGGDATTGRGQIVVNFVGGA